MPFSEAVKKKVKEMANFQCCKCYSPFVDVHHIIPEAESHDNEIDNAVPLCPNCHKWFGGNPELRKIIRMMRDFHYENCRKQKIDTELLKKMDERLTSIETAQSNNQEENRKLLSDLGKITADRIFEIVKEAKEGKYPDSYSFGNDIITASGTASTVFEHINNTQKSIKWKDVKKVLSAGGSVAISGGEHEGN